MSFINTFLKSHQKEAIVTQGKQGEKAELCQITQELDCKSWQQV